MRSKEKPDISYEDPDQLTLFDLEGIHDYVHEEDDDE